MTALGTQSQPVRFDFCTRQRHPSQFQREQAADGIDVEVIVELDIEQLADIFDGQPRGNR